MTARHRRRAGERGAAVVDFVLALLVLVPLVLGILQVALVLHVRNTLAAAAAEGARYAATADQGSGAGERVAREQVDDAVASRFAEDVTVSRTTIDGQPVVRVSVRASVPALGIGGPAVDLVVTGHAVEEQP